MSTTKPTNQETEELIVRALKKIGSMKEKDLCKFLPSGTEGYMHHFTLKKLRTQKPEEFKSLLNEFILNPSSPKIIDPKPRTRRNKSLSLNQADLKLILNLAQKTDDQYLLSKLGGKLSLSGIKKELIKSIREGKIEEELWSSYMHAIESIPQS